MTAVSVPFLFFGITCMQDIEYKYPHIKAWFWHIAVALLKRALFGQKRVDALVIFAPFAGFLFIYF